MKNLILLIGIASLLSACNKDPEVLIGKPTPYNLEIPKGFSAMRVPPDNPLTVEGVDLGKRLFFDPILSGDNTQSCASCHNQKFAFTDNNSQFSKGITGAVGNRNSMPLFNLGWSTTFFWDGGVPNLESQVIGPITNPIEMHEDLEVALAELNAHKEYPSLFNAAFGTDSITTKLLMFAIAQYERTLISGDSKYDKWKRNEPGIAMTAEELNGLDLFQDQTKGDCNHCHSLGSTFTDFEFRNTGLDSIPVDKGLGRITMKASDDGKFKTPSVRNLAFTGPYMHDGRFKTLDEVVEFYNTGFHYTTNLDPNLVTMPKGRLTPQDKKDIIAFLNTLNDYSFITNPKFQLK